MIEYMFTKWLYCPAPGSEPLTRNHKFTILVEDLIILVEDLIIIIIMHLDFYMFGKREEDFLMFGILCIFGIHFRIYILLMLEIMQTKKGKNWTFIFYEL